MRRLLTEAIQPPRSEQLVTAAFDFRYQHLIRTRVDLI